MSRARLLVGAALGTLAALAAPPVLAQPAPAVSTVPRGPSGHASSSEELDAFLAAVDREVRRFEQVDVAIAEGYRKLGPDFPGMGEHWIHPGLVIAGALDPARPPVIAYTSFGSERRLLGVAYTSVLGPGAEPPTAPFPPASWHDHTGGVDEESLLLAGPASMHRSEPGFRLAMVHVWTPVANPHGVLAQNNWALPFLRAGLAAPEDVSSQVSRALSLAGVGEAFYEQLLRDGIGLRDEDLRVATAAFASGAAAARAWLDRHRPASGDARVDPAAIPELEALWTGVWRALDDTLGADAREKLAVLRR